jgi:hypothetical protein
VQAKEVWKIVNKTIKEAKQTIKSTEPVSGFAEKLYPNREDIT